MHIAKVAVIRQLAVKIHVLTDMGFAIWHVRSIFSSKNLFALLPHVLDSLILVEFSEMVFTICRQPVSGPKGVASTCTT